MKRILVAVMFLSSCGLVFACPWPNQIVLKPTLCNVNDSSSITYVTMENGSDGFYQIGGQNNSLGEQIHNKIYASNGTTLLREVDGRTIAWDSEGVFWVETTVKVISAKTGQANETREATVRNKVLVVKIEITRVIPSYYSWADSHVPVVFRVKGPEDSTAYTIDQSGTDGHFIVNGTDNYIANGSFLGTFQGDYIGGDFSDPNIYSAIISKTFYKPVLVPGDPADPSKPIGLSQQVGYRIKIRLDYDGQSITCYSFGQSAERYGDFRVPVFELGQHPASSPFNLNFDTPGLIGVSLTKSACKQEIITIGGQEINLPSVYAPFSDYYADDVLSAFYEHKLEIRYKTKEAPNGANGFPMKITLGDARLQIYAMPFYGRKTVNGIADIIDLSKNTGVVDVAGFRKEVSDPRFLHISGATHIQLIARTILAI
jgi:hypothetical protein